MFLEFSHINWFRENKEAVTFTFTSVPQELLQKAMITYDEDTRALLWTYFYYIQRVS